MKVKICFAQSGSKADSLRECKADDSGVITTTDCTLCCPQSDHFILKLHAISSLAWSLECNTELFKRGTSLVLTSLRHCSSSHHPCTETITSRNSVADFQCYAIQNRSNRSNQKSEPFNTLSPESGNWKKVDIQSLSPRFRSQQCFLWKICRETLSPNL